VSADGAPVRTAGPVLVVGTGLLGTSAGLALAARGVEVLLADPSPSAVALAADLGAGRPVGAGGAAGADPEPRLVVVAAPPDVTAAVVAAELARHPEAVVTDVASVKAGVLAGLRARGADLARYAGGHPMAGRERSGAIAARADLFVGRPWVLCPAPAAAGAPGSSAAAVAAVADLAADVGGMPVVMPAEEHDQAVALVSHLPQVAASLVAARLRAAPEAAVALAGQGLRDVTRVAASDPALWVQILGANAGRVAQVLAPLRDDLDALLEALRRLDGTGADGAPGAHAALARALGAGVEGRARIPGKHGSRAAEYSAVTVLVDDRPGELARLFADIAAAGVNLEELRLDHSPGRALALAEVSVLPAARTTLVEQLGAHGWAVHEG
jgi:prephenate dehydrogenase